jgi:hypothetical protein
MSCYATRRRRNRIVGGWRFPTEVISSDGADERDE